MLASPGMTGRAASLPPGLDEPDRRSVEELLERATAALGHPPLSEAQLGALDSGAPGRRGSVAVRLVRTSRGERGRVIGFAQALRTPPDGHLALEVVADPAVGSETGLRAELAAAAAEEVAGQGGGLVRLWVPWGTPEDDSWAVSSGFEHERDLVQLRCRLPLPPDERRPAVATRAFRPGRDEAAWLRANNRAFAGHPEQGGWEVEVLLDRERQPWFDPEGFRVHEEDGAVAAWCWTKVHGRATPPMGEIYVIGVDPDYQGRGLGRALARAGLDWLAGQGLEVGMLYVDATNQAAFDLYRSLGFVEDHADRAYRRVVAGRSG